MEDIRNARRLGIFEVSQALIVRHPDLVRDMLKNILITRAELLFHSDAVEYIGYSGHFPAQERGLPPKRYLVAEKFENNVAGTSVLTGLRLEPETAESKT
ncbi:MAG: hypothetical protein KAR40_09550 [Candidatus Sabulitectum sp.]|nr:hypothetical protein [Candidatus Sabulitectum sp.]